MWSYQHVDVDLAQKFAIPIEDLDTPVTPISHIDVACIIGGYTVRGIELARTSPRLTPGLDPVSVFVDLGDPRINVTVTDIDIACCVPGHVGDLVKLPIDRRKRWLWMFEWTSAFVGSFLPASEDHQHPAFRAELDDHVGTLVGDPDVIFLVHLYSVRKAPCVKMMTDLANELSVRVKLKQLSRCRAIGGPVALPREKTKTCPFELTATPATSPE